ncbi:MAG: endonuclease MutS2 [Acidobacteria bacterium]|nr:endonuclease MutS2 [Acidobacteriota bacterium]
MNKQSIDSLEFPVILELISLLTDSEAARPIVRALKPLESRERFENRVGLIKDVTHFLGTRSGFGLSDCVDLTSVLAKKKMSGVVLEMEEFIHIRQNLTVASFAQNALTEDNLELPFLEEFLFSIPSVGFLTDEINRIFTPENLINDNASPALKDIRSSIASIRKRVYQVLESKLSEEKYKSAIQDDFITKRSGRFVLMLKADFKGAMKGIIHDSSGTGYSVFIEPMEIVEMNNKLAKLDHDEKVEIRRILMNLTSTVFEYERELRELNERLLILDQVQALGRFSIKNDCVFPAINDENKIVMKNGRHPLLDERIYDLRDKIFTDTTKTKVVPISISLSDAVRGLVISGPNMGGKTVSLKTLGLLVLMAQTGIPVPAEEISIPFFKQVSVDIGDKQEITRNLSTFSSHLIVIKQAIEAIDNPTLVLLDEIGTGTDPEEGSALARAILDFFLEKNCFIAITTHSNYLKMYSYSSKHIKSAAVEFDSSSGKPTYKLIEGSPGSSKAFQMAKEIGFPGEILDMARNHLESGHQYLEEFIDRLESERKKYLELQEKTNLLSSDFQKKLKDIDEEKSKLEVQRQKFAMKAKQDWDDVLDKYERKLRKVIDDAKERASALEIKRQYKEGLKTIEGELEAEELLEPLERDNKTIELPEELQKGDRVKLRHMSGVARLRRHWKKAKDKKVLIEVKGKNLEVTATDIIEVLPPEKPKTDGERMYQGFNIEKQGIAVTELMLLGKRGDEVEELLSKFIDDAVLAGLSEVRVVHGYGTGVVKNIVLEYLRNHPMVKEYSEAPYDRGGGGATEVKLKD